MQIKSALNKLSNRKSPDYRGSIKDSIGAVEGVAAILTGEPMATLGKALREIIVTIYYQDRYKYIEIDTSR